MSEELIDRREKNIDKIDDRGKTMDCFTLNLIKSDFLIQQYQLYALSKLKYKNHKTFCKFLLLLSGDIEANPGPQALCEVCQKNIAQRHRILCCYKCNCWVHKKCANISEIRYISIKNKVEGFHFDCNRCNYAEELPFFQEQYLEEVSQTFNVLNDGDLSENEDFKNFDQRGLHFIHLNINSILSKIDELRIIAFKTNAAIIGISESKIDDSVLDGEISINGYTPLRSDRTRQGGGVICYIRNDISFNKIDLKSENIEHIFIDIFLPKTKPITIGILYRPTKQTGFLKEVSTALQNITDFHNKEVYILGDINIYLIHFSEKTPMGIRKYTEFCALQGLTQIIKKPTRITEKTSTLLDHILVNSKDKISQTAVIDLGLSDHQMIYCTMKILRPKTGEKTFIKIRSLKHYSKENLNEKLTNVVFPNYSNYVDINEAYSDFIKKVSDIINEIAPTKEICIKNNTAEWIDEEVLEGIKTRDKLFRKFKKSKSNDDNEMFKKNRNQLQELIKRKKKNFITQKLTENISKPRKLWKTLKTLGLPNKNGPTTKVVLGTNEKVSLDNKENAEKFKHFYENLASNLVNKLPTSTNNYGKEQIRDFYKPLNIENKNFKFKTSYL